MCAAGKCLPPLLLDSILEYLLGHRDGDGWSGKVKSRKKRIKEPNYLWFIELCFHKVKDFFSVYCNSVNIHSSEPREVIFKFFSRQTLS